MTLVKHEKYRLDSYFAVSNAIHRFDIYYVLTFLCLSPISVMEIWNLDSQFVAAQRNDAGFWSLKCVNKRQIWINNQRAETDAIIVSTIDYHTNGCLVQNMIQWYPKYECRKRCNNFKCKKYPEEVGKQKLEVPDEFCFDICTFTAELLRPSSIHLSKSFGWIILFVASK